MNTNTPTYETELLSAGFIDKVQRGLVKEAQDVSSIFIRDLLREDGFLRRLFTLVPVTQDDLDLNLNGNRPMKIIEKDFHSKASYVSFKGEGERNYFEGKRFPIYFDKIETERTTINTVELATYRTPIQELFKEYNVKYMQEQEDKMFINQINDMIDDNAVHQKANLSYGAGKTLVDAFIKGQQMLTKLRLPMGKALMHRNTFLETLNLKIDTIGNEPLVKRFESGLDGEESFLGVPIVTTIKDDIVKEGEIYFFSTEQFFGKFYALVDATMTLESKADLLTWWTYEYIGMGIGNTKGAIKITMEQ